MEEEVKIVTPQTSLRSVLCQQAVFEGGEKTGIFLSSRAYIEWECWECFQVPEPEPI